MPSCRPRIAAACLVVLAAACAPTATGNPGVPAFQEELTATATMAPPASASDVVQVLDQVPDLHSSVDGYAAGVVEIVASDDTVHRLPVRLARTPTERAHGLMEVPDLPNGTGMWFVFDDDRLGGFWMKNTLVPLDIAYVGADHRIVTIADAVPCPPGTDCPNYPPDGPYRTALEVPAGYLARIGVDVGDTVRLVEG